MKLYTLEEASAILDVTIRMLYYYESKGHLKFKEHYKTKVIDSKELENFQLFFRANKQKRGAKKKKV